MKIGFIGCGNMGSAMIGGILKKGVSSDNTADITVITEKTQERLIREVVSELKDCTVNSIIRVAD